VVERAFVGGLDSQIAAVAVNAGGSVLRLDPDVNIAPALDSDDLYAGKS